MLKMTTLYLHATHDPEEEAGGYKIESFKRFKVVVPAYSLLKQEEVQPAQASFRDVSSGLDKGWMISRYLHSPCTSCNPYL